MIGPDPVASRPAWSERRPGLLILGIATFFALLVFRNLLVPGNILFTTDDNIGALALRKWPLPHSFLGWWYDAALAGTPQMINLCFTNVLLWLLPVHFFANWIHAIDLVLASWFLGLFLRKRGLGLPACLLGALAAFWLGSTFFLTYAGHIGKFGVVMFAALYLWQVECAILSRRVAHAVLAGGAMGGMMLEQADSGLFFALPLGVYALFGLWREGYFNPRSLLRVVLPLVAVAGLLSVRPVLTAQSLYGQEKASEIGEDEKASWEYSTQWSWPPEETIEFIAPGYLGWRSGDAEGPYWGRMGRSAGWEETKQGFRNFRLETFYLGAIPVLFFAWALVLLFKGVGLETRQRRDLWFWTGVTLVTYLLALGKFFFLYRVFYLLPGIASIRNPVKFMQVTQLALAVLAAVGVHHLLGVQGSALGNPELRRLAKRFAGVVAGVGVLLAVWAFAVQGSAAEIAARFQGEGWGSASTVIASNMARSLAHAATVTLVAAAVLAVVLFVVHVEAARARLIAALLLVGLAAGDQLLVSPRYVQSIRAEGFIEENGVTQMLKQSLNFQRPYLLDQSSFYNLWLTYLFPYQNLPAWNVTQLRMPEAYVRFLSSVRQNPEILWQSCAIGYFLGPAQHVQQLLQDARLSNQLGVVYAFSAYGAEGGGVKVSPGTAQQPGQHAILKYRAPAGRYTLVAGWDVVTDDEALARLSRPDYRPFARTMIAADQGGDLPASTSEGTVGEVSVMAYRPGQVALRVSSERPAILRAADMYTPDWRATVDGRSAPVRRCDYLFQGVYLEPGLHEVVLTYRQGMGTMYIQVAGLALCVGALPFAARRRRA